METIQILSIMTEESLGDTTMSKALESAIDALKAIKNGASKFSAAVQEGNRIIPSKANDASIPVRIDAGKYNATTKKLPVILQVNSQARTGLADWRKKNSSHAKLATEEFDTTASDANTEYKRVLDSLKSKGKEELKKWLFWELDTEVRDTQIVFSCYDSLTS